MQTLTANAALWATSERLFSEKGMNLRTFHPAFGFGIKVNLP